MICANMGVLDDNYSITVLRASTEMDPSNSEDVNFYNLLVHDKDEMDMIGDSFCDLNEKGSIVPALMPDNNTITRLVRLGNNLRAASQHHFAKGDRYLPGVRNSAQRAMDVLSTLRGFFADKDGTKLKELRAQDSQAKACYLIGLNATHTSIVGSAMKYEYEDAKVESEKFSKRLSEAIAHSENLLYDFCFTHDHGVGISNGNISAGLFNEIDQSANLLTALRDRCSVR